MKPEQNKQEEVLKKAIKEYGGEDPGKEFTFRVMDAIMAEARKTARVWKPLLGWWFWGGLAALISVTIGLAIFLPGESSSPSQPEWANRITDNEVVGKVAEQAPVVVEAFNRQSLLWMGLIAIGSLILVDRILKMRSKAA